MSLTSTDILLFATVLNWVLKYLNVSLSTVVTVSSHEETAAPSEMKKTRLCWLKQLEFLTHFGSELVKVKGEGRRGGRGLVLLQERKSFRCERKERKEGIWGDLQMPMIQTTWGSSWRWTCFTLGGVLAKVVGGELTIRDFANTASKWMLGLANPVSDPSRGMLFRAASSSFTVMWEAKPKKLRKINSNCIFAILFSFHNGEDHWSVWKCDNDRWHPGWFKRKPFIFNPRVSADTRKKWLHVTPKGHSLRIGQSQRSFWPQY